MIINPQIYLAPFQGITGPTYRDVYTRHFPYTDKLFTPFFTNVHKQKSLSVRAKELENPKQKAYFATKLNKTIYRIRFQLIPPAPMPTTLEIHQISARKMQP